MVRDVDMTIVAPSTFSESPAYRRTARERRSRRAGRAARQGLPMEFFGVLYFCLVVLAGGILVWQPARVAQMNQQMAKLEATLQDLRMQSESLKKTVSAIESLDYVEREARTRLGMVSPTEVRTFAMTETAAPSMQLASLPQEQVKSGGILSLFGRIAQIFGAREATAKGQR